MRAHLLVSNDFPPKVGGIQNYLWELWKRLPPAGVTVLTTPHAQAAEFDAQNSAQQSAQQAMTILRDKNRVLLPHPRLAERIKKIAKQHEAELVIYDPALPLGAIAKQAGLPYGLVLHGAEITVPARLPVLRQRLAKVLNGAEIIVSAGGYAAAEAERCAGRKLPIVQVPPGVDTERFVPLSPEQIAAARQRYGLSVDAPLVVGTSRLVPRKGFDRLIEAVGKLRQSSLGQSSSGQSSQGAAQSLANLQLAIVGAGRDARRLAALARKLQVPVKFLGRVSEDELPAVMGMGDVFAMPCRNRWAGLEQEGFGIVFLEAAAAGVCAVAGRSGGSHEAVLHGQTGIVLGAVASAAVGNAAASTAAGNAAASTAVGNAAASTAQVAAAIAGLLNDDSASAGTNAHGAAGNNAQSGAKNGARNKAQSRAAMAAAARKRAVEEFDYDILAAKLESALG